MEGDMQIFYGPENKPNDPENLAKNLDNENCLINNFNEHHSEFKKKIVNDTENLIDCIQSTLSYDPIKPPKRRRHQESTFCPEARSTIKKLRKDRDQLIENINSTSTICSVAMPMLKQSLNLLGIIHECEIHKNLSSYLQDNNQLHLQLIEEVKRNKKLNEDLVAERRCLLNFVQTTTDHILLLDGNIQANNQVIQLQMQELQEVKEKNTDLEYKLDDAKLSNKLIKKDEKAEIDKCKKIIAILLEKYTGVVGNDAQQMIKTLLE